MPEPDPELDVRVLIRDILGYYLCEMPDGGWDFLPPPTDARVFLLMADKVSNVLEEAQTKLGTVWFVEPVDMNDLLQACDQCGTLEHCRDIFFDGASFRCQACRETPGS